MTAAPQPRYANSFIVEAAAKAKTGDPAAIDFLICHCAETIATCDRHDLVKIFKKYNADTSELADRAGVKRKQIEAEMEICAKAARNCDYNAIVRIRRYLIDMSLKAPYAVWLSFQDVPLKNLPAPGDGSNLILLPSIQ
jgi:hypothetical protein